MSKFIELLEDKITTDLPSTKDVFIDLVKRTKDYNKRTIGRHIFCPGPNYKKEYSSYLALNHRQRVNSDGDCTGIWGVGNVELYKLWYDHINDSNDYPNIDRIAKIGNEILSDDDIGDKIYATRIALLTPDEMINKGVYNKIDPSLNFFKVVGVLDTLDNGVAITKWFEEYQKHYRGISSDGWIKLYSSWKSTLRNLFYQLDHLSEDDETETKLRIEQSILELGWVPNVPFKSSTQCIHKLIKTKQKKPINISTYIESVEIPENFDEKKWLLVIFIHNDGYTTPYITTDFKELYKFKNDTLEHTSAGLILKPVDIVTVYGCSISNEIFLSLNKILKKFDKDVTEMNTNGFDIDSTVKEGDIDSNFETILKLFLKAIASKINDNKSIVDILKIASVSPLLIYDKKPMKYIFNTIQQFLAKATSITSVPNTLSKEEVYDKLEKGDTRLNLSLIKPQAEAVLTGVEMEMFDILYEQCIGEDTVADILDEMGSYSPMFSSIILETRYNSKSNEYEQRLNKIISRIEHSDSDKAVSVELWKLSKEIEQYMYSNIDKKDKSLFAKIRSKCLKEFNELVKELEKRDPTFDIKQFLNKVATVESTTYIDTKHIKYSFNTLKYK